MFIWRAKRGWFGVPLYKWASRIMLYKHTWKFYNEHILLHSEKQKMKKVFAAASGPVDSVVCDLWVLRGSGTSLCWHQVAVLGYIQPDHSNWREAPQETLEMGQKKNGYIFKITVRIVSSPQRHMKGEMTHFNEDTSFVGLCNYTGWGVWPTGFKLKLCPFEADLPWTMHLLHKAPFGFITCRTAGRDKGEEVGSLWHGAWHDASACATLATIMIIHLSPGARRCWLYPFENLFYLGFTWSVFQSSLRVGWAADFLQG